MEIKMKKLLSMLLALAVLLTPVLALADGPELTVTGSATVSVPADYAVVNIGVRTSAATAQEASAQNVVLMAQLMKALNDMQLPQEDIVTAEYSVFPRYDYNNGTSVLTGYEITNMLNVTVRDITQLGAVLDAAIAGGANETYGISFSASNVAEAQDRALVAAVEEAQRKASLLAKAAGYELGKLESITEATSGGYYAKMLTMDAVANAAGGTEIIADGVSVSATVTLMYELK